MTYVLPPIANWAAFVAMGCAVLGFFTGAAGLLMAIPHLVSGGGRSFGERAYRANQRHGEFYTSPRYKRERMLVFVGFATFYISFAFIWFLMLAFGQPVAKPA